MVKHGGDFEAEAYSGLSTVGHIQLVVGAVIVSILTIIMVIGGIVSMNPLLVVGALLFGGLCLWIQYQIYHSKSLSALEGGLTIFRLV